MAVGVEIREYRYTNGCMRIPRGCPRLVNVSAQHGWHPCMVYLIQPMDSF